MITRTTQCLSICRVGGLKCLCVFLYPKRQGGTSEWSGARVMDQCVFLGRWLALAHHVLVGPGITM